MEGASATMDPVNAQPDEGLEQSGENLTEISANSADNSPGAMPEIQPHRVVEAILLATDTPLAAGKIAQIVGVGDARDVRKHIITLNEQYERDQLSFRIEEIAGGYQILTLPAYNNWLTKLLRTREETRLSSAAMETLSIVAYKQPCTRADIEVIRGVAAGDILNRLREINLVKIVGRAEELGRPMLYGTTKRFLEVFGLASLEDLPQVEALRSGNSITPQLKASHESNSDEPGEVDETARRAD